MTKNFHFSIAERLVAAVLGKCDSDLDRNSLFARMNLADDVGQFLGRCVLKHVCVGSLGEGSSNLMVQLESGQDDNAGVRELGANVNHCVYGAHVRKAGP